MQPSVLAGNGGCGVAMTSVDAHNLYISPVRKTLAAAVGVLGLAFAAPAYADIASGWTVLPDTTAGGAAVIVTGPGTPPAGIGSLRLTVASTADRALVGTDLGELTARPWTALSGEYSTYVPVGSPPEFAPTLRFAGFQAGNQRFTTLSFEPRKNGTVIPGQWQAWTLGPAALVWQTNTTDGFCQQSSPCTFAAFAAQYPAGVWGLAQLGLGSGLAGPAAGYVDAVTLREGDTVKFTDFDPPPASSASPPAEPAEPTTPALPDTGTPSAPGLGLMGIGLASLGGALFLGAGLLRRRAWGVNGTR